MSDIITRHDGRYNELPPSYCQHSHDLHSINPDILRTSDKPAVGEVRGDLPLNHPYQATEALPNLTYLPRQRLALLLDLH